LFSFLKAHSKTYELLFENYFISQLLKEMLAIIA
jgi:hypothetical protein